MSNSDAPPPPQLPKPFRRGQALKADRLESMRANIAHVLNGMIKGGKGILVSNVGNSVVINQGRQPRSSTIPSRLQITRTAPASYDAETDGELTANDFFISFGLYNALIPTNIDEKHTLSGIDKTYFWLKVTLSETNPAYASAVVIENGTTLPTNDPVGADEFPSDVYILIGHVDRDSTDDSWAIDNYGNGNASGGAYVSAYNVDNDGIVTVKYGFSHARF